MMSDTAAIDMPPILAELRASAFRRVFALLVLLMLGALLLYLGIFSDHIGPVSRGFLVMFGLGDLYVAGALHQATGLSITLSENGLCDSAGRILARIEDIRSVSRGTFAFKPSHGFSIRLKTPGTSVWAPGMWWRTGTRIGVGGVVAASQAKAMSELLALMVQKKHGG